jgi:hypothetical protein
LSLYSRKVGRKWTNRWGSSTAVSKANGILQLQQTHSLIGDTREVGVWRGVSFSAFMK